MEKKTEPFLKKLIASIIDFDKYQEFAVQSLSEGFKYFLKLTFLVVIIITISFTVKVGQTINSGINYLKNDSPYFKFEDNILTVEAEDGLIFDNIEEFQGIIIVDTKQDLSEEKLEEYNKKLSLYSNGIIILNDRLILRNELVEGETIQTYKELAEERNIGNFDKNDVAEYFSTKTIIMIYISIFISLLIVFFMTYLFGMIIESILPMILGYLLGRTMGLKLKATNVFNITVHAMTLSALLRAIYMAVNLATGFYIQYFDIMYVTIIFIYIVTALFIIRSTLIKQHIELMKIMEEQKKVKEEIKENSEKPKEQEKKEDKDEKKEEKKEEGNIGKEVEGEV